MLGIVEGSRDVGKPNMEMVYSIKEATILNLQELSSAAGDILKVIYS